VFEFVDANVHKIEKVKKEKHNYEMDASQLVDHWFGSTEEVSLYGLCPGVGYVGLYERKTNSQN